MNYSEAIEFLLSFPDMERGTHGSRGSTMSLNSMRSLLNRLGNPHQGRNTIHVTGSKGKGSTSIMIASILRETGFNTALFTSPHLHSYCERIEFNLEPVAEEEFARGLTEILPAIEEEMKADTAPLSTFGLITALFFHLAATRQPKTHWQVVEVGMGGRFDITNVFDSTDLVVITPISLEHTEALGSTPTEIANNKAGIIKPGSTTILAPQKDMGARSAVARNCAENRSELIDVGRTYKFKPVSHTKDGQTMQIDRAGESIQVFFPLLGQHQMLNAVTAVAAADALAKRGVPVASKQIIDGLKNATLPGRLEIMQGEVTEEGKVKGPLIVLDGAHNHESAAALASALKQLFHVEKCIFVVGVNSDKNITAIWRELEPLNKFAVATKSQNARALDPVAIQDVIGMFEPEHPDVCITESVPTAVDKALSIASETDVICIMGSLYVVAEAREYLSKQGVNKA